MNQWTHICLVDDIPRLGARVVRRTGGPNVAVFRTAANRFFALADRCPHRGGPLSQGMVFGERVACPLHNTCVELESGCAVAPDKGSVQSFPVKVEAGIVYVDLEGNSAADTTPSRQSKTPSLHPEGVAEVEPPLGAGSRG
jgi:nitrite reductase (NADH) small subunit